MELLQLIKVFGFGFFLSVAIIPVIIFIYKKLGWMDDPKKQNHPKVVHKYPVPRGGGVAIFLVILISSLIFLPIDKHLVGILMGAFLIAIIGVWDDVKNLNPYFRLGLGFLAATLVVGVGIGVPYISNPFISGAVINLSRPQIPIFIFGKLRTIWILADLMALFWIVSTMNFVNWSKGLDGQLPGIVVVASSVIGLLSLRFVDDVTQWPVIILAFIVAASYLGLLLFNFYPQKIMPGYGGGTLAGYFLAVLSILSGAKVATAILVLGIPMMDALYSIFRRILQGKSPFWGDRGHLHHKLMDFGWGKRRIAIFYWLVSGFLGFLALNLNAKQKMYTIVLLAILVGALLLWLNSYSYSLKKPGPDKS
ncbi:MAG: MraY family glycosyltransferase [Candidatus Beckwithbacteria bacterium]|nr:undecaprenyl/decaprenyl-phosphate alpha-N-acetylglucosaminyl 1-phosphate transferase [Patescibacteria group bacterium]